jgi:hypothetical protein
MAFEVPRRQCLFAWPFCRSFRRERWDAPRYDVEVTLSLIQSFCWSGIAETGVEIGTPRKVCAPGFLGTNRRLALPGTYCLEHNSVSAMQDVMENVEPNIGEGWTNRWRLAVRSLATWPWWWPFAGENAISTAEVISRRSRRNSTRPRMLSRWLCSRHTLTKSANAKTLTVVC